MSCAGIRSRIRPSSKCPSGVRVIRLCRCFRITDVANTHTLQRKSAVAEIEAVNRKIRIEIQLFGNCVELFCELVCLFLDDIDNLFVSDDKKEIQPIDDINNLITQKQNAYIKMVEISQNYSNIELKVCELEKFFIVRIAWLFGGPISFVNTMIKVGKTHDEVKVVTDQIGTPTYSKDLARLLVDMILTDKYGYYHATNEGGYISWYEFCKEIYKQYGLETKVTGVTTEEYGLSKAVRPFNSRLDKSKLVENGFEPLPAWEDALSRYLKEQQYV